ncbi:class I SAM-dependent methyltransferase [Frankia gtarii]|uniref:class I SAM-dependent methyltransferase n=1 Tax=Frankia gtarii TaxID=2950102 RepID=UPI0021BEC8FA|nr:class I SAM-dependent methyltransferase [Frankia gtarii]
MADCAESSLLHAFYSTARAGALGLSDGGGPFGFDISVALQVDTLIRAYDCDGIVETGCFLGDTAAYLARRYPTIPLVTCDINPTYTAVTRHRLRAHAHATVHTGDSAQLLPTMAGRFTRPFVYLDAHWLPRWPLGDELNTVAARTALVCVDDVDIGHARFGYDRYDGRACDPTLLRDALPDLTELYLGDPTADYPYPCLQVGRRTGHAYLPLGLDPEPLHSPMFRRVPLRPSVVLPTWTTPPADDLSAHAPAR